jgi:hypothetical protein
LYDTFLEFTPVTVLRNYFRNRLSRLEKMTLEFRSADRYLHDRREVPQDRESQKVQRVQDPIIIIYDGFWF